MQEDFQKSAGNADFAKTISRAKAMFASLADVEAGFSGKDVLERLERGGLTFEPGGADQVSTASYRTFDIKDDRSFVNAIKFRLTDKDDKPRSEIDIDGSTWHELIHADSWDRVPELHASPFNKNTPIILCPEDHILMTVITERVAYANMGWLLSLAQKNYPEIAHIVTPVNGAMFDYMRKHEGGLAEALSAAGDISMRVDWGGGGDYRDKVSLLMEQYYHWQALNGYQNGTFQRAKGKDLPLVVRLEPHNIEAMAESFGPNIIRAGQDLLPPRGIDQAWIGKIYERLGELAKVPSYENLPTFDEGLARFGYSPKSFLEMSKTAGTRPAVAPVEAAVERKISNGGFFGSLLPGAGSLVPA